MSQGAGHCTPAMHFLLISAPEITIKIHVGKAWEMMSIYLYLEHLVVIHW